MSNSTAYPLCHQFGLSFVAYEDRLMLSTQWQHKDPVRVLLTRRMVILILQRLLTHLPEFSRLEKTPRAYWREALHIAHQQALKMRESAKVTKQTPSSTQTFNVEAAAASDEAAEEFKQPQSDQGMQPVFYLATEVSSQRQNDKLILGLNGLPLPDAMTSPSPHTPILALSLEIQHLHQLLQLFLTKASEAQWHLPVELPWMTEDATQTAVSH